MRSILGVMGLTKKYKIQTLAYLMILERDDYVMAFVGESGDGKTSFIVTEPKK